MVRVFSGSNPVNTVVLFFYALLLKLPYFFNPLKPALSSTDGLLYNQFLAVIDVFGKNNSFFFQLLAFFLLFTQAISLNRFINTERLLPSQQYLTAMAYLLLSSAVPEWNRFSSIMVINTLIIWCWPYIVSLFNHRSPKTIVYNIALGIGISSFFYMPSFLFFIWLLVALFIFRPFNIAEWLVGLLGILTPYYFAIFYFFMADKWDEVSVLIPALHISVPELKIDNEFRVLVVLVGFPLLIGFSMVLNNLGKMVVQVRKSWSLLIVYFLLSFSFPFLSGSAAWSDVLLLIIPLAVFHAAGYFFPRKIAYARIIHWIFIAWIIIEFAAPPGWLDKFSI